MKKTYIKPQATVVAMEDNSQMLCGSGDYGTTTLTKMGFTDNSVTDTEGFSKRHGGGLWDDEEE